MIGATGTGTGTGITSSFLQQSGFMVHSKTSTIPEFLQKLYLRDKEPPLEDILP